MFKRIVSLVTLISALGFFTISPVYSQEVALRFLTTHDKYSVGDSFEANLWVSTQGTDAVGADISLSWSENLELVSDEVVDDVGCKFNDIKTDSSFNIICFGDAEGEFSLEGESHAFKWEVIGEGELKIEVVSSFGEGTERELYVFNDGAVGALTEGEAKVTEAKTLVPDITEGSIIALSAFTVSLIIIIVFVRLFAKKLSKKMGRKKATVTAMFAVVLLTGSLAGVIFMLARGDTSMDDRGRAAVELDTVNWYVYPEVGDCVRTGMELGKDCWEGGIGIQGAVDAIPGDGTDKDYVINIKNGSYSRMDDGMKVMHSILPDETNLYYKCFVYNEGKSLQLIGESKESVIFNGEASKESTGICVQNGTVDISSLTVQYFKDIGTSSCDAKTTVTGCGRGNGMIFDGSSVVELYNTTVKNNAVDGINMWNSSTGTISGNTISGNGETGITMFDSSTGTVRNNIVSQNQHEAIFLLNCTTVSITNNTLVANGGGEGRPGGITMYRSCNVTAKNNIIAFNNERGIYRSTGNVQHKHTGTLTLDYNNVYQNVNGDYVGVSEGQRGANSISIDPLFIDRANNNFLLQSTSPSKNAGDAEIVNPDGSRSDMGAYGGPGACLLDSSLEGCVPEPPDPMCLQDSDCDDGYICSEDGSCIEEGCASFIDLNCDGLVNMSDYAIFVRDYLKYKREGILNVSSDFNSDDEINMHDYHLFVIEYLRIKRES